MTKQEKIAQFDPNGVGLQNGHFIGLPFTEEDAEVVLISVPWDVTVSYADGTSTAPENILHASAQLDLYTPLLPDAWKMGIYMRPSPPDWINRSEALRKEAKQYIEALELNQLEDRHLKTLHSINNASEELNQWVYEQCQEILKQDKLVGLIGGEHSVPLGYLKALAEKHDNFGVLQVDAHMDLRPSYENFTYSHASIFFNALGIDAISKLTQVGIRDYCHQEVDLVKAQEGRVQVFYDHQLKEWQFRGQSFDSICEGIVDTLPELVYISFDIDGLDPSLCPNTGTPVPGGLQFYEATYLIQKLVQSGRKVIGFDLCEVGGLGHEWDGNVGARMAYFLSNWMGLSNGKI